MTFVQKISAPRQSDALVSGAKICVVLHEYYVSDSVNATALMSDCSLRLAAALSEIDRLNRVVGDYCRAQAIPVAAINRLSIALDEIIANIINHSHAPGGALAIDVRVEVRDGQLIAEITDTGQAFDPLGVPEPNTTQSLDERQIGGLGIHLVRRMTDRYTYERRGACNQVTIALTLPR